MSIHVMTMDWLWPNTGGDGLIVLHSRTILKAACLIYAGRITRMVYYHYIYSLIR